MLIVAGTAFAQSDGPAAPEAQAAAVVGTGTSTGAVTVSESLLASFSDIERKTLALDIAVSNYYELKAMAAKYNLSQEGSSEELRSRLYEYFKLSPPVNSGGEASVTIESASSLEYFTLDGSSDSLIKLGGPITLSIKTSDGFSHKVTADEILFDRNKNIVQAKGHVIYRREGLGRSDEFSGSTIIIDLNSYAGVFLDGAYNLEPTAAIQRTLSFQFEKMTRHGPDLTIMEQANVTACDEIPPHYHIRARKVWLFENGDWALSGATLYLGVVPVLWLPFFYYPSDELLFHPVFGYRSREGAFVQSTTYLIGDKPRTSSSSSSLSLFNQREEGIKEISGVFIKRRQTDATSQADNGQGKGKLVQTASLKILADIYSSLGAYIAIAGDLPQPKSGGTLDFSLGLALSRSLFLQTNGFYSPFDYSTNYTTYWNTSNFLGVDLPLRFGITASLKLQKSVERLRYSVNLDFPLYSDPFFEQDFNQRNESTALLSALDTNTTTIAKRSTMTQSLQSSLLWTAPSSAVPAIISNANLSRLAAQMTWMTKTQSTTGLTTAQKRLLAVDPQREFFYPDSLKPLDTSFSLSGNLARYDSKAKKNDKNPESPKTSDTSDTSEIPTTPDKTASLRDFSKATTSLDWSASGSASFEEKFRSSSWYYPEDVDGAASYLLFGWKGNTKLSSTTDFADRFLSARANLGLTSQDQVRPYLYDERILPTTVHPYRLSDYMYKSTVVDANADLALSPFTADSIISSSSLDYSIGTTLFKNIYSGLSGSGVNATPIYASTWIGWNSDTFSTHSLTANLVLAPKSKATQKLSFSASLPPVLERYTAGYSLDGKYFSASLQGAFSKLSQGADLLPSSLTAMITGGATPFPVFRSEFSWDFDASAPLSSVSSLEYGWAKAAFTAKKSNGYIYAAGLWNTDGTEYFRPYEMSVSLSPRLGNVNDSVKKENADTTPDQIPSGRQESNNQKSAEAPSLRFNLRPTLSYSQNLVRFTESILSASLDLSLTSEMGTSLSFQSVSSNKSAWRYWPAFFPSDNTINPNDYYRNFLTDLAESLSIWDTSKLKNSLFKLQSLSLKLSQDLHDWNLAASLGMSPVLVTPDTGRPYYQLDFSFSLSVTWKDIPEIKTSLSYTDGSFTN